MPRPSVFYLCGPANTPIVQARLRCTSARTPARFRTATGGFPGQMSSPGTSGFIPVKNPSNAGFVCVPFPGVTTLPHISGRTLARSHSHVIFADAGSRARTRRNGTLRFMRARVADEPRLPQRPQRQLLQQLRERQQRHLRAATVTMPVLPILANHLNLAISEEYFTPSKGEKL